MLHPTPHEVRIGTDDRVRMSTGHGHVLEVSFAHYSDTMTRPAVQVMTDARTAMTHFGTLNDVEPGNFAALTMYAAWATKK